MDLKPLILASMDILTNVPFFLNNADEREIRNAGYSGDSLRVLGTLIKSQTEQTSKKYVAVCTSRILEMYKSEPSIETSFNLNEAVSIFDFLKVPSTAQHVLKQPQMDATASALSSCISMLPCVSTDSELVQMLGLLASAPQKRSRARKQATLELIKAFNSRKPQGTQVYFDWLKECGEEL